MPGCVIASCVVKKVDGAVSQNLRFAAAALEAKQDVAAGWQEEVRAECTDSNSNAL